MMDWIKVDPSQSFFSVLTYVFVVCSKHPKRCNSKLNCEDMPDSLNMFTTWTCLYFSLLAKGSTVEVV